MCPLTWLSSKPVDRKVSGVMAERDALLKEVQALRVKDKVVEETKLNLEASTPCTLAYAVCVECTVFRVRGAVVEELTLLLRVPRRLRSRSTTPSSLMQPRVYHAPPVFCEVA